MKWLQSDGKLSNGMMTVKGSVSDLVRRGTALHWLGPLAFSLPLRGNANCNSKGSFYKLSYTFNLPPVSTSCCYDHGRAHCLFFYWMRVKSAGALGSGCAHHVPASPCAGFTRFLLLLVYVKEMRSCEQCDRYVPFNEMNKKSNFFSSELHSQLCYLFLCRWIVNTDRKECWWGMGWPWSGAWVHRLRTPRNFRQTVSILKLKCFPAINSRDSQT